MARVSIYTPQIRIPVVDAVRVPVDDTGAVIANTAARIEAAYETKQKQDAGAFVAKEASGLRLRYLQRMREDSANGRVGENYTGTLLDEIEIDKSSVLDRAPNRYAQEAWEMAFIEVQGDVANNASGMEVQANLARRMGAISETLNNNAASLALPGATADDVVRLNRASELAILAGGAPADKAPELVIGAKRENANAYYRSLAENDPERALKEIKSGVAAKVGADASQLAIYANQAQSTINQREAKANAERADTERALYGKAKNAAEALKNGAPVDSLPIEVTPEALESVGMPDLAADIRRSAWVGNLAVKAATMTPAELVEAEKTPEAWAKDVTSAAVAADDVAAATSVLKAARQARILDPAGQATLSDAYRGAVTEWETALANKASPEVMAQKEAGMVSALIETQRKNGTPEVYIRAFPKAEAALRAQEWAGANGVEKLKRLSEWKRQYGAHNFKYVRNSLSAQFANQPDMEALLILDPNDPDAQTIANAYDVPLPALKAKTELATEKSIENAIRANTTIRDHYASAIRNGSNLRQRVNVESMAKRAAMYMISNEGYNGNAQSAVDKVARTLFKKNAYINAGNGTVRIPATMQSQGPLIADGLWTAQKSAGSTAIPWDKLDVPAGIKREDYVRGLRSDGYFVSKGDTSGATLVSSEGRPITVGGKEVVLPWDRLKVEGAARQGIMFKPAAKRTKEENKRLQGDLFGRE